MFKIEWWWKRDQRKLTPLPPRFTSKSWTTLPPVSQRSSMIASPLPNWYSLAKWSSPIVDEGPLWMNKIYLIRCNSFSAGSDDDKGSYLVINFRQKPITLNWHTLVVKVFVEKRRNSELFPTPYSPHKITFAVFGTCIVNHREMTLFFNKRYYSDVVMTTDAAMLKIKDRWTFKQNQRLTIAHVGPWSRVSI